jgi:hypothetical protein
MKLFKHASEQPPKNYDRFDGYTGIEHSPNSKPPHGRVPVQRDVPTSRTEQPAAPGRTAPSATTEQPAPPVRPRS